MKFVMALTLGVLFSCTFAQAGVSVLRKVKLATVSSVTCYTAAEEANQGYQSNISFNLGKYITNDSGVREFNYYDTSASFNTSSELCIHFKLIEATNANESYEKRATTLYVDGKDELIGFDDQTNKNLVFIK